MADDSMSNKIAAGLNSIKDDGERSIGQDFFPDTESNRKFFARERENARRAQKQKEDQEYMEKEGPSLVKKIPNRKR